MVKRESRKRRSYVKSIEHDLDKAVRKARSGRSMMQVAMGLK